MKRAARPYFSKIPRAVNIYLREHFQGAFYIEVTPQRDEKGTAFYRAEVSHENKLYHLRFNSAGTLVKKEVEPLLELLDEDFGVVD